MRVQLNAKRSSGLLCLLGILIFLIGSSFAQAPPRKPDGRRTGDSEPDIPGPNEASGDKMRRMGPFRTGKSQPAPKTGEDATDAMPGPKGMGEMMRRRMGPFTPREFYPSLMRLPELSPEKRAEIKRFARQRMEDGMGILTNGRETLRVATEKNDLDGMERAAADMRAGIDRYGSGLAAFGAIEYGEGPREIALSWFRREMDLDSSGAAEPGPIMGMTIFHASLCLLLILFASAMAWMYLLRMRRAAALLRQLSKPPTSSDARSGESPASQANLATRGSSSVAAMRAPWSGAMRIASIYAETPNVKTFRFVDPAGEAIGFHYLPGQFLTLSLEVDGKPAKRAYTIASTPTRNRYLEITVKREEHGLVSRRLHDGVNVGDSVNVTAPAGRLTFTGSEHDSIVLIGGGVGITPLMSVIRALTDIGWRNEIYFLYTCRTPEEFIFREELSYLQERNLNLRVVVTFSRVPNEIEGFHRGHLTKELIANSVPEIAGRRIHLCGSPPMAESVKAMLAELGVPPSEIKSEAFGSIKRKPGALDGKEPVPRDGAPTVTFSLSDKSGPLTADATVLDAADAIGVDIDNACRSGTCGSCKVPLKSGAVTMEVEDALAPEEKEAGMILACQAKSDADATVEA